MPYCETLTFFALFSRKHSDEPCKMWQTCINVIFYCLVWILLTPFKNFTQVSALRFTNLPQEASFSVLHSCSLTSEGKVLKILSSTIRPLFFSNLHSPSSTGRHSSLLPLSSSCVRLVSSPNREGRDCRQLFPRFSVRNFLHWNNSGGSASIYGENESIRDSRDQKTKLTESTITSQSLV